MAVALAMAGLLWLISQTRQVHALATIRDLKRPEHRSLVHALLTLAVGAALCLWSHDTGALAAIAVAVEGLGWWVVDTTCDRRAFTLLLLAVLLAAILFLPYLKPLLSHMASVKQSFWIPVPNLWAVRVTVVMICGGMPYSSGAWMFPPLALLAAAGVAMMLRRKRYSAALLLVSVFVVPVALESAISLWAMPILLPRTLVYISIPFYLAVSYGVAHSPGLNKTLAALTVATMCYGVDAYFQTAKKEPWRDVAAYLSSALRAGQPALVVSDVGGPVLKYYARRQHAAYQVFSQPDFPEPAEFDKTGQIPHMRKVVGPADAARIAAQLRHSQQIALVLRGARLTDPHALITAEILKTHIAKESRSFFGDGIVVTVFTARQG